MYILYNAYVRMYIYLHIMHSFNSFFCDFGPHNLAMLYRYCLKLNDKLKVCTYIYALSNIYSGIYVLPLYVYIGVVYIMYIFRYVCISIVYVYRCSLSLHNVHIQVCMYIHCIRI